MEDVILEALAVIAEERAERFEQSFALVSEIVVACGEDDLAERVLRALPEGVDPEVAADLFGLLVWATSDNGAALVRTAEGWLVNSDDSD